MDVTFFDSWVWLIFVGVGLVLVMMELFIGIDTGLDLVFIGSAFILGGLITLAMESWIWTPIASGGICVIYIVVGRRYIHGRTAVKATKTNIDTIIGKTGIVQQDINPGTDGIVRVGKEQWRAQAEETIKEGSTITVTSISGVTLTVKNIEGGKE